MEASPCTPTHSLASSCFFSLTGCGKEPDVAQADEGLNAGECRDENDAGNDFDAAKWSRYHWAWVGEDLYYCPITDEAESEDAAIGLESPDDSDPLDGGCHALIWTALSPG